MLPNFDQVEAAKQRLAQHPIYRTVRDGRTLRVFMQHHAVCVLDFMSLVKRLQSELTCCEVPWVPAANPELARFVNEVVLDEESDSAFGPRPASHYEWYLGAMEQIGAETRPIRALERRLRTGVAPSVALGACQLPAAAIAFSKTTFDLVAEPLHVVASVFLHGREDLIPRIFLPLVHSLRESGVPCDLLLGYLERHIEVDGGSHAGLAERMLSELFGGDAQRAREGAKAALRALEAREALWDAVVEACEEERHARTGAAAGEV